MGLFNFDTSSMQVSARFSDVGASSAMNVRDLVTQTDLGMMSTTFTATLAGHASRLIKLTP